MVEAIAAIVVLAIAVPPAMWAIREAHVQRVNPRMASTARWLAVEKIEDAIADRHSTTRGYAYVVNANYATESPVSGFAGFTRSVSVTETGADLLSAGTGYKRVVVTVSWTDATSTSRSLTLTTVVTDY
jgi:hypothetical protein